MILAEIFCGQKVSALKADVLRLETARQSQIVRTSQSIKSCVLVCVIAILYLWTLWFSVDMKTLLMWVVSINCFSIWRLWATLKVSKNISTATAERLVENEAILGLPAIALSAAFGVGNWIFSSPSGEYTSLTVTLFSCLFAVGSTIGTVAQRRILALVLLFNLGQGVLFFATRGIRVDYGVAFQIFALMIFLLGFAKRLESIFVGLVKSDLEVKSQNETLRQSRAVIEAALQEALRARTKNQVLTEASHDLSQPLHAMTLFINTLKNSVKDNEKQSDLVEKIESSADMLKQQFDGLVDLSRFDADAVTVDKQNFDLFALCELLLETKKPSAAEKNLELLVLGKSVMIHSDPVLLGRLIGNLISNAIKFSDNGLVEIVLSEINGRSLLSVTDSGCGFTEIEKDRIFNDFVQLDNATGASFNGAGGAGLGLSIVRRIAILLDLEVSVKSDAKVGSIFTVMFPQPDYVSRQGKALNLVNDYSNM